MQWLRNLQQLNGCSHSVLSAFLCLRLDWFKSWVRQTIKKHSGDIKTFSRFTLSKQEPGTWYRQGAEWPIYYSPTRLFASDLLFAQGPLPKYPARPYLIWSFLVKPIFFSWHLNTQTQPVNLQPPGTGSWKQGRSARNYTSESSRRNRLVSFDL